MDSQLYGWLSVLHVLEDAEVVHPGYNLRTNSVFFSASYRSVIAKIVMKTACIHMHCRFQHKTVSTLSTILLVCPLSGNIIINTCIVGSNL